MQIFVIAALLIIILALITKQKKVTPKKDASNESAPEEKLPVAGAYQKKWLLSYNEKDAYQKLLEICKKYELYLMTKVRMLDLVEPVKGNPKYKSYFWKIQAKHVDFVICDKKLVARCIIELDDSTHDTEIRKERDEFVNEVLGSVGYHVIHLRGIDSDALEKKIISIFKIKNNNEKD